MEATIKFYQVNPLTNINILDLCYSNDDFLYLTKYTIFRNQVYKILSDIQLNMWKTYLSLFPLYRNYAIFKILGPVSESRKIVFLAKRYNIFKKIICNQHIFEYDILSMNSYGFPFDDSTFKNVDELMIKHQSFMKKYLECVINALGLFQIKIKEIHQDDVGMFEYIKIDVI